MTKLTNPSMVLDLAVDMLLEAKRFPAPSLNLAEVMVRVALVGFGVDDGVREVTVPSDEWSKATEEERMDLVFKYGQNDFQSLPMRSVSVGDVFMMPEEYPNVLRVWEVCDFGFADRGLVYKSDYSWVF